MSTRESLAASQDPSLSRGMRALFRVLEAIEYIGNLLPHPFWLFWILAAILAVVSAGLAAAGVTVTLPDGTDSPVQSLLSVDGIVMVFSTAMENFVTFAALPVIVSVILGVAVAERSGILAALLRVTVVRLPAKWVTFSVAFAAMISHVMFDAAFVVLLPLAALAFRAVGRSPALGIVVAYASISAGYNASPLVTPSDAIISALTTQAAAIVDPEYVVTPIANYFWSAASSLVLAVTITLVVELALARRSGLEVEIDDAPEEEDARLELDARERRGMLFASLALALYVAAIVAALWPSDSPLRGEGGSIVQSVVLSNIAIFIGLGFVLVGVVYGRVVGSLPRWRDVPEAMAGGMRSLAPVLVLFFAIAQFLAYFRWTGIGNVIAINGAGVLERINLHPLVLLLGIILVVSVLNVIITSGSAMWSILAPVLVPLLMYVNIPPETTQVAFRIADSTTNAITPMSAYFVLALGMVQRYRPSAGIGTVVSFTLPLALSMLVVWSALFVLWYLLGLPLGPGAPISW